MHEHVKLKLSQLKRFNIHGNGTHVCPDGNCVNFSEVHDLLRDETSGAKVVVHINTKPDGNESDKYYVVTSNEFELCFTENEWKVALDRFGENPWLPRVVEPKSVIKKTRKRRKDDSKKKSTTEK